MNRIKNKKQFVKIFIIMLIILTSIIIISIPFGSANITIIDSLKSVLLKVPVFNKLIDNNISEGIIKIITEIRLPRILIAGIVGLTLASTGAVYQGLFRNSMADPYILGISSGAAFGATISIVLNNIFSIELFAFVGAISITFLIYFLSKKGFQKMNIYLILTGININYLISAIISLLMILNNSKLEKIMYWTMGSFSSSNWNDVLVISIITIPCFIIISIFGKYINVISVNDDLAKSVGINTNQVKKILIFLVSLMTAVCVSTSGIIGFVGLMIPHIARLLFGGDYRYLIPLSRNCWSNFSHNI